MLRSRRHLGIAAVTVTLVAAVALGLYLFSRFESGVQRRRAASAAVITAQALEHHRTEVHLCEVAINGQDAKLRALIDALGSIAPVPKDRMETQARADSAAVIARFLAPIDCEKFVATGREIPQSG